MTDRGHAEADQVLGRQLLAAIAALGAEPTRWLSPTGGERDIYSRLPSD